MNYATIGKLRLQNLLSFARNFAHEFRFGIESIIAIFSRWSKGETPQGVCYVPCNRRVEGSNLQCTSSHCVATLDKLLSLPIFVCVEGNGKPPHSSHPQVA